MIEESDDEIELKFVLYKFLVVFLIEFLFVQEGIRLIYFLFLFLFGFGEESFFILRNYYFVGIKGVRVFRGDLLFFGGKIYVFDKLDGDMRGFGFKLLCLEDLKRCFFRVVREIVMREVILGGFLGTIVFVFDIDLL